MHIFRFDALSESDYSLTKTAEWEFTLLGSSVTQYAGKMLSNGSYLISLASQAPNEYFALIVDDLRPYPDIELQARVMKLDRPASQGTQHAIGYHQASGTVLIRQDARVRRCDAADLVSNCEWLQNLVESYGSYWYFPTMGKFIDVNRDWLVTPHHVSSYQTDFGYGVYLRFYNLTSSREDFKLLHTLPQSSAIHIRDFIFSSDGAHLYVLIAQSTPRYFVLFHYMYNAENNTFYEHQHEKIESPHSISDVYANLVLREESMLLYIFTNLVGTCAVFWRISAQNITVHDHMNLCGHAYLSANLAHKNSRNYFGSKSPTPYLLSFTSHNEELLEDVRLPEDVGEIVSLEQIESSTSHVFALVTSGILYRYVATALRASPPHILTFDSIPMCCMAQSSGFLFVISKEVNQTHVWKVNPSTLTVVRTLILPQVKNAATCHRFTFQNEKYIAIAAFEMLVRIRVSNDVLELQGETPLLEADSTPTAICNDDLNSVLHVTTQNGFIVIVDLGRMRRRFRLHLGMTLIQDMVILGDKGLAFYLANGVSSRLNLGSYSIESVALHDYSHLSHYSAPLDRTYDRSSTGMLHRDSSLFITSSQYPQRITEVTYTFCAQGTYLLNNGLCRDCAAGTFSSKIDSPTCTLAPPASYVPEQGMAAPTLCPKGTFGLKDVQGATSADVCHLCPLGTYGDSEGFVSSGETNCTKCPLGTYNGVFVGATSLSGCAKCPAGMKGVREGSTNEALACGKCGPGEFNDEPGRRSCMICPAGTSHTLVGSTRVEDCLPCPKGYYSTDSDLLCLPCPFSTYLDVEGGTSITACKKCPVGKGHSSLGASSFDICMDCPSGFYYDATQELCSPCPAGSYLEGEFSMNKSCTLCPMGTFFAGQAGISRDVCTNCPVGTYSSQQGSSQCIKCPKGYYGSQAHGEGGTSSDVCIECPPGTYQSEEGVPNADFCLPCPPGTARINGTGTSLADCTVCPVGTVAYSPGSRYCEPCEGCTFIGSSLSSSSLRTILSRELFTSTENEEKRRATFNKTTSLFPGAKIVFPIAVGILLSCCCMPLLVVCCCFKRSVNSTLADLDLVFPRRHIAREGEPLVKKKTILGGLASMLTFVIICSCISIIFFDFFAYNIIETEGLALDAGINSEGDRISNGAYDFSVFLYGMHSRCEMDGLPKVRGVTYTHNESRCEFINEPPRVGCQCFWKCTDCRTVGQVDIDFHIKEPIMTSIIEYYIAVPYSRPGEYYNVNGSVISSDSLQIYTGSEKALTIDFILFSSVYSKSKRGLEMFIHDLFRIGEGGWIYEGWLPRVRRVEEPTVKRVDRFSASSMHIVFKGTRGETQHIISENKTQTVTQFIASLASTTGMVISIVALVLMIGEVFQVHFKRKKERKIISSVESDESLARGFPPTLSMSFDQLDEQFDGMPRRGSHYFNYSRFAPYVNTETEIPRNVSMSKFPTRPQTTMSYASSNREGSSEGQNKRSEGSETSAPSHEQ